MKNRQLLSKIPSLVMAMFILSLFSGVVAADTPREQYDKDRAQYQLYKDKYDNTLKSYEEARDSFDKANAKLRNLNDNKSKEELKLKAKEYLLRLIDHSISQLEVLKYRVELREEKGIIPFNASATIESQVTQLEQIRAKVQGATTYQELAAAHRELKEQWVNIRLETRYYIGIVLNHRIDRFIAGTDNVTQRMDKAIQRLNNKSIDTSKLMDDETSFRNLVQDARTNQQKTVDLFRIHDGFADDGTVTNASQAVEFLRQGNDLERGTIKTLKDASKKVLEFVRDFRTLSGGKGQVSASGELEVNDSGKTGTTAIPTVTITAATTGTLTASPTATTGTNG